MKSTTPEDCRTSNYVPFLFQDLRLAARWLAKAPGFTAVVVATLGLCIGANAAIFSVIESVLLRPLPFPESHLIVRVGPQASLTARMVDGIAASTGAFSATAAGAPTSLTLTGTDQPELVAASVVGTDLVPVFGLVPMLGRALTGVDAQPGSEAVVLISHGLWLRRFAADSSVVGRTIALAGEDRATRTVIGVMPSGYQPFPWMSDAFVPVTFAPGTHDYSDMARFAMFGRLRPETTTAIATTELQTVLAQLATSTERGYVSPSEARQTTVVREHEWRTRDWERSLWMLFGSAGIILLIGGVNIANLQLARATTRQHQLAVRRALGATQARIVQLLLAESALLGTLGGFLGYASAAIGVPLLGRMLPTNIPNSNDIEVDLSVFGFAMAVSILGAIVFGLLPAFRSRSRIEESVKEGSRGKTHNRDVLTLNQSLVAAEVALCVALAATAGLFGKSLSLLRDVDPGFEPAGLYTLRITLSPAKYPDDAARQLAVEEIERRVSAVPGVAGVGSIQVLPMTRGTMGVGISPDGNPIGKSDRPMVVSYRIVTPGYIEAAGMTLIAGRHLESTDRTDAPPVGLVNTAMVEVMWPNDESAVGQEVRWANGELWFTVVGVVADVHQNSLAQAGRAEAYVPYAQDGSATTTNLMLRGGGPGVMSAARSAVWQVDSDIPVTGLSSMTDVVDRSLATPLFHSLLFGIFAALAIVLAAVGIYGVTAYTVTLRTREIGIRLAFGASSIDVVRWLARSSLTSVIVGVVIGLLVAITGARLLVSMLFGVTTSDPAVLASVIGILVVVAVVAMGVPARRALRIDPIASLNSD